MHPLGKSLEIAPHFKRSENGPEYPAKGEQTERQKPDASTNGQCNTINKSNVPYFQKILCVFRSKYSHDEALTTATQRQ